MSAEVDRGAEVRHIIRRERWQRRLSALGPLLFVVVVVVVVVGAIVDRILDDGWRDAEFHPEQTEVDPPTMWLDGGGCDLELRTTVTETAEVVSILLEERGTNEDGCGNGTQIALQEPVGDRDVIDEATGQRWGRGLDPDKPRRWIRIEPADE